CVVAVRLAPARRKEVERPVGARDEAVEARPHEHRSLQPRVHAATRLTGSPTRMRPVRTTVAYTPALFALRRTTVFMTRASCSAVSGFRLTITQRTSRTVT